jgi:glucose-1-phosphate cytidylyltransferase
MVEIGGKPVLWHIMKVLATQGIKDFIICAGYKSEYIENYFHNNSVSKVEVPERQGGRSSSVFGGSQGEFDWTVEVVDTGELTMTGGRIKMIEQFVQGETFLATYGDGIADIDLNALLEFHSSHGKAATMTVTQPTSRFGVVDIDESGLVSRFREKPKGNDWINIGYFVFQPDIFSYLTQESVLEEEPLRELASASELSAYQHKGFWEPMDTYREYLSLNELWQAQKAPWKNW